MTAFLRDLPHCCMPAGEVLAVLGEHLSTERCAAWTQDSESTGTDDSSTDDEPVADIASVLDPKALTSLKMGTTSKASDGAVAPRTSTLATTLLCNQVGGRSQPAPGPVERGPGGSGPDDPTQNNGSRKRRKQSTPGKPGPTKQPKKNPSSAGQGGEALRIRGYQMPTIPVAEGFNKDVLPKGESLRSLLQFFDKNRPCSDQVSLHQLDRLTNKIININKTLSRHGNDSKYSFVRNGLHLPWLKLQKNTVMLPKTRPTARENLNAAERVFRSLPYLKGL